MKKKLTFLMLLLVFVALSLASCQNTGTRPTTTATPTFEVVFVAGDGEILKTETVALGQSATAPEVPLRSGYVFVGWDTDFSRVDCPLTVTAQYKRVWTVQFVDAAGDEIRTFSVVDGEASPAPNVNPYLEDHTFAGWDQDYSSVTSDMIIRPVFEAIQKLTVTFLGKDGQVLKTQSVYPGGNAMPPAAPAVAHFTFKGWDKEYTNVQEDLTVNAVYEEDAKYTVSFYDHAGYLLYSQEVYAGERATAPILHLAPHFTFKGWDKTFMNVQSDLDVYAIVEEDAKYTVTFIDREGNILKNEVVYVGEDATAPEAPLYEGFTFIDWNKDYTNIQNDLTVTALYRDNNKFSVVFKDRDGNILKTEDVSLGEAATAPEAPAIENYTFAGWDKDFSHVSEDMVVVATYTENAKYTVQFVDYNGDVLHSEVVYVGKSATAPANPSRENHTFTGWDKDYTNVQGDLTVSATYSENAKYTVTFVDYNGNILKTETVYVGKSATAPATPIHQNLKFTGWDKSFDSINGDLTVTAQYQRYYTVTFMGHDGTVLKAEDVAEGGAATPPAAPIRDGYVFAGWDNAFDVVNADVVVTAQYEIVKHNVSFSVAGGNAPATQVVEHGGVATRPEDPVREGFDFVEWRVNGVKYDFSAPVLGDMTVVAVFKSNGQVPAATNTTLRLDPDRLEMWVGITLQLNVMPYNATKNFMANSGATFDFISTDPEILSIEDDGTFTAHALGSVKVYAVVTKGGSYTGSETYTAAVGDILPAIIIDVVETPEYYKKAQEESDQKITLGSTSSPRINKNDFLAYPTGEYGSANIALWYNGAEGVFTMTADDNPNVVSEWQKWLVAYEASGIPTTFITPSEDAYTNEGTAWEIITSNTPHAVQSHGATHLAINAEHSTARIWHEFYFGRQQIAAVSGMDALIIGYANGTNYAPISSLFFIGGRGTVCVPNSVEKINYNQINSYSGWAEGAEYFTNVLFGSNANNGWISVHYHSINQGLDVILSNYAILAPYLESGQLWAPQFAQASQYGQERDTATLTVLESGADVIRLVVTDEMNDILFYQPLSVRVKVDGTWKGARAYQNGAEVNVRIVERNGETYLMVDAVPDKGEVTVVRTEMNVLEQSNSAIKFEATDSFGTAESMTATFPTVWNYAYATQGGHTIPAVVTEDRGVKTLTVTFDVNGGEVKVVPLTNEYDGLDAYTMTMIANGVVPPDASKPITVSSAEELMMLSRYVLLGNTLEGMTIELTADIDMTGADFAPIGRFFVYKKSSSTKMYLPFKGTFNGNNHTIYNLNMYRHESVGGIFGYIENAVISDLHVKGNISAIDYVGGIAGNAIASTISRCSFEGTVEARVIHQERTNGRYVGGIVGNMTNLTLVEHCSVNGKVQTIGSLHSAATHAYIGGLAGSMAAGTINNSSFVGTVEAIYFVAGSNSQYVGGIVGNITGTGSAGLRIVSNCFAKCTVTGDEYVGGISGNLYSNSSTATIKVYNCAVQGTVNGQERVGGLSGHGQGISGTVIDNCFADVKVNAPATATYVGTILGSFQAEGWGLKVDTNFYVESNNPGMPVAVKFSGGGTFSSTAVANGAAAIKELNAKAASSAYYSWELKDGTPSPTKDDIYRVLFLGKDGETLLSVSLPSGATIEAPTAPDFLGFNFIGWDKAFSTVEADMVIVALYQEINVYTVTFVGKDGEILKTEQLEEGTSATAPSTPSYIGFEFTGWDNTFENVVSDLTVTATYKIVNIYTVTFIGKNGETLKEEQVNEGLDATAPSIIDYEGYRFDGWDVAFTNVTSHLTVKAQYVKLWTVTYLDNAGEVWKVEVYDEGAVPVLPTTAPAVSGFIFKEWNPASLPAIYEDVVLRPVYQVRPATAAVDYKVMVWSCGGNLDFRDVNGIYGNISASFKKAVSEVNPDIIILDGYSSTDFLSSFAIDGYTCWAYGVHRGDKATESDPHIPTSLGYGRAILYKTDKFAKAGDVEHKLVGNLYNVKDGNRSFVIFPLKDVQSNEIVPVVNAWAYNNTEEELEGMLSDITETIGALAAQSLIHLRIASSTDIGLAYNNRFNTEADANDYAITNFGGIVTKKDGEHTDANANNFYYSYMLSYAQTTVSAKNYGVVAMTEDTAAFPNRKDATNSAWYTKAFALNFVIGSAE